MMANEKETPAVVIVCDFVMPKDDDYTGYINYIDRAKAVRKKSYRQFESYAGRYMDNKSKTKNSLALFNFNSDKLSKVERQNLKEQFRLSQANKSPLWQVVISFDNDFLRKQGILNKSLLDEDKIRKLTRKAVLEILKSEDMTNSAVWAGAIHYNTDNIHIHVAISEPYPTREIVTYKGKKQYKGKFKSQTLKLAKSAIVKDIFDRSQELEEINKLIRQNIVSMLKVNLTLNKNRVLNKKLKLILQNLPSDKRLWKYNMNAMKNIRPLLDDFSNCYIKMYHKSEYKELIMKLQNQDKFNKQVYGKTNGDYVNYKLNELHTKMGNTVLKYLKEAIKAENGELKTKKSLIKAKNRKSSTKFRIDNLRDLKRALKKDFQSVKNQRVFENLESEISYLTQLEGR